MSGEERVAYDLKLTKFMLLNCLKSTVPLRSKLTCIIRSVIISESFSFIVFVKIIIFKEILM